MGILSNLRRRVAIASTITIAALGLALVPTPAGATGQAWAIVPSADGGAGSSNLNGVSCTSTTNCVAVGYYDNGSVAAMLAEHWNGTAWSLDTVPTPPGSLGDDLGSVSCTSSSFCVALGTFDAGAGPMAIAVHWNGSAWSLVSIPHPSVLDNGLNDIACLSTTDCTAVGTYNTGATSETYVARWDGTAWSIVPSPNVGPPGTSNGLRSVSCTSATTCMAVGVVDDGSSTSTLAMTWDGSTWTIVPSPNAGSAGANNNLGSVACTSATSCVAVGRYFDSGWNSLAMTWNGSAWTVVPAASPGVGSTRLQSIACVSATACTAVGTFFDGSQQLTMAQNWDGSTWTLATTPTSGTGDNDLRSIACLAASDCVAVGIAPDSNFDNQTLVLMSTDPNPPAPPTTTTTTAPSGDPVVPAFTG